MPLLWMCVSVPQCGSKDHFYSVRADHDTRLINRLINKIAKEE